MDSAPAALAMQAGRCHDGPLFLFKEYAMSDLATLILLLALVLALIGALRLDLLGLIWREWLKLGDNARRHPLPDDKSHGPYSERSGMKPHRIDAAHKPPLHRSGRRG
jgi:hypothetical protein